MNALLTGPRLAFALFLIVGVILLALLADGGMLGNLGGLFGVLIWLILAGAAFYGLFMFMSLPFRRAERARRFLELLEEGARTGCIERFLVRVSQARETSLGLRFHALAAWLEKGLPLDEALERVPRLLPPQITALLRVGRETGQLPAMLPACRERLRDTAMLGDVARSRLLLLAATILPLQFAVCVLLRVFVIPKFEEICKDMGADIAQLDHFMMMARFLYWNWPVVLLGFGVPTLLALGARILGPRGWNWLPVLWPRFGKWVVDNFLFLQRLPDWLACRLPWTRHRLQRDFTRVLAQLLDLRLPEERAVRLAAESTANFYYRQRAERIAAALRAGTRLPDALTLIADGGDLRWRLDVAAHAQTSAPRAPDDQAGVAKTGFHTALAGWLAALEAKAFQEEQAVAHLLMTGFVLANGALVALLATGMMQILISLIAVTGEW